jgi:hypothetical protein
MFVYVVELWSNGRKPDPHTPIQEQSHHVEVAHIASSEKAARKWALSHLEYGGMKRLHRDYYFPWHFKIRQCMVDEDVCHTLHYHDVIVGKEIHPRKYHKKKEAI